MDAGVAVAARRGRRAARCRPALRPGPDRPPPPAVPPRRHLRAQLPRPVCQDRARLASRPRPLLRGVPGVVPLLLALAAAEAGAPALAADVRRTPGPRGARADVALPRPRRHLVHDA